MIESALSLGLVLFALFFLIGVSRRGRRDIPDQSEDFREFKMRGLYQHHEGNLYGAHSDHLYDVEESPKSSSRLAG
jgi:hypothetical protein